MKQGIQKIAFVLTLVPQFLSADCAEAERYFEAELEAGRVASGIAEHGVFGAAAFVFGDVLDAIEDDRQMADWQYAAFLMSDELLIECWTKSDWPAHADLTSYEFLQSDYTAERRADARAIAEEGQ